MNDADGIDPGALNRLRDLGGPAFLRQMLGLFLELAHTKLEAARVAEAAGDMQAVANAVHPLRSSSGNVGAHLMQELAARIDDLARTPESGEVPELLRQLEAAFARAKPRLETEKDLPNHEENCSHRG